MDAIRAPYFFAPPPRGGLVLVAIQGKGAI